MPRSDPHPPAEPELAWLLHSALVWALTGALLTMARRPLWSAVGVVLTVLGTWHDQLGGAAAPATATAEARRDRPASQQQAGSGVSPPSRRAP